MSAVIADQDGEPGGLDSEETVLFCRLNGNEMRAQIDWFGKTAGLALSFRDGLEMAGYLIRQRRESGH